MNVMSRFALWCAVLAWAPVYADPVAACRATHSEHPQAHIACLERALREQSNEPRSLGAEQVRQPESTTAVPAQAAVEIIDATYTFDGLGVFRMADGQIWKTSEQTPAHQRLAPGQRYSARIERGKLGGYRMYVDGIRRMVKVRRIE